MIFKGEKNNKVIVGMSGGVDSSVSAILLKESGYQVTGVFLAMQGDMERLSRNASDAKKVCEVLEIPFEAVDVREKFGKTVVRYFLDEYEKGRTPNPCVFCNENLKFKTLFEEMERLGADWVATGHYARIKREIQNNKLKTAKDPNKDQSYFLYRLKQSQLEKILFPLGEYEKTEVRKIAEEYKLPVFDKDESQDICFLAGMEAEEFLKKNIKPKKGEIVDAEGNILGRHSGLAFYTLGQRKGINIGGTGPYYVIRKDYERNRLVVSNDKREAGLFSSLAVLEGVNWISGKPKMPAKVFARTRYRNPLVCAKIETWNAADKKGDTKLKVVFEKSQRAVTPGQSVVFYTKEREVIGGGIIG